MSTGGATVVIGGGHVETIRRGLAGIPGLRVAGRNGMHRYNNMDDSILTGLFAARSVLGGAHDPWSLGSHGTTLGAPAASPAAVPMA